MGRTTFSRVEADRIRKLLIELRNQPQRSEKTIRGALRKIGFYIRDWKDSMDVAYFDDLIKRGQIKITASDNTASGNIGSHNQLLKNKAMSLPKTTDIRFKTIDDLRQIGFEGFVSVSDLWKDNSIIPNIKGVYMVVRTRNTTPEFLAKGTGGFYNGEDPNVPLDLLRAKWVDDTCVVYIGKAGGIRNGKQSQSTLRSRIKLYLSFGQEKPVGHQGGCYIWQLKDAANLLFCWKPLPADDPRTVEAALIQSFKSSYGGHRPFANRQD